MAITAKLQLNQSQSLVMTPQLLQSIKLLQYSNVELLQFIESELERNPVLEIRESGEDRDLSNGVNTPEEQANGNIPVEDIRAFVNEDMPVEQSALEQELDTSLENVFDAGTSGADANTGSNQLNSDIGRPAPGITPATAVGSGDLDHNLEAYVADRIGIQQYLIEQVHFAIRNPAERAIAEEIIASMDDDGYLRRDLAEVAEAHAVGSSEVSTVLQTIHTFDPPGICARNLSECLAIQLQLKNRFDPLMRKLLANLDLLARHDFDGLMKACGASLADLVDMVAEIRALNPRPASQFDNEPMSVIVPDVFVNARADGGWFIELNTDTLPKVLVNRTYYAEICESVRDPVGREFMVDCLQNANWLVKSLDQRAQTILKVTTEIVKQQDMFFTAGVEHLRPLNLKTVADNIGMHESTVSRVTANKYIMSERGIFEMRYFFTTAISATDGDNQHAAESVRHKIRQLIVAETAKDVLSDEKLVERLNEQGIDIARRTVAKYRESMHIPSSVQRRREKKGLELTR